jgi:hypothetical protein
VDIEFVGKEQRGRGRQVREHRPDTGQFRHPLRVILFGGQLLVNQHTPLLGAHNDEVYGTR